jgi:ATP-dependent protease ClpP protease subunit
MKKHVFGLSLEATDSKRTGVIDILDSIDDIFGYGASQFMEDLTALGDVDEYNININSPGGDVFESLAMCNYLQSLGKPIKVTVLGQCASAATFFAAIADEVVMPENTFFLVHKPWTFCQGNADDLASTIATLQKVEDVVVNMYTAKTGKTDEEIRDYMQQGEWWTAEEAKTRGFCDSILPAVKVAACVKDLEDLGRVGDSVRTMVAALTDEPKKTFCEKVKDIAGVIRNWGNEGEKGVAGDPTGDEVFAENKIELKKRDLETFEASLQAKAEELERQQAAMSAEHEKLQARIDELDRALKDMDVRIGQGVLAVVDELGIKAEELPSPDDSEKVLTKEELLAIVRDPGRSARERWDADAQLNQLKKS